ECWKAWMFSVGRFASCFCSAPLSFNRKLFVISFAMSSWTANRSASLRLYCWPHICVLSCALISSTLIARPSPLADDLVECIDRVLALECSVTGNRFKQNAAEREDV